MITACFSSGIPTINVFNSEYAILSFKGLSVGESFRKAIEKTAEVLDIHPDEVIDEVHVVVGTFEGFVSDNGRRIPCRVIYPKLGETPFVI